MKKFMTKAEALASFRETWNEFLELNPSYRGDSIAKRLAWNDHVDALEKNGDVDPDRSYNWSNPF